MKTPLLLFLRRETRLQTCQFDASRAHNAVHARAHAGALTHAGAHVLAEAQAQVRDANVLRRTDAGALVIAPTSALYDLKRTHVGAHANYHG